MQAIPQVEPRELARRRAAGESGFVLLDVREADEVAAASLPGAVHIPMSDIPRRAIELDDEAEIIVMCHHGQRSQMVAQFLRAQRGFEHVKNLRGGIHAYATQVDPSIGVY